MFVYINIQACTRAFLYIVTAVRPKAVAELTRPNEDEVRAKAEDEGVRPNAEVVRPNAEDVRPKDRPPSMHDAVDEVRPKLRMKGLALRRRSLVLAPAVVCLCEGELPSRQRTADTSILEKKYVFNMTTYSCIPTSCHLYIHAPTRVWVWCVSHL